MSLALYRFTPWICTSIVTLLAQPTFVTHNSKLRESLSARLFFTETESFRSLHVSEVYVRPALACFLTLLLANQVIGPVGSDEGLITIPVPYRDLSRLSTRLGPSSPNELVANTTERDRPKYCGLLGVRYPLPKVRRRTVS